MDRKQVEIEQKNPIDIDSDVLLIGITCTKNPANSLSERLFDQSGASILDEVKQHEPLRIGNVLATGGGQLSYDRIVHIPTQTAPDVPTTEENVQVALRSGLVTADEEGISEVVVSGLKPEITTDDADLASLAETIMEDIFQYPPRFFSTLRIVNENEKWVQLLETVRTQ